MALIAHTSASVWKISYWSIQPRRQSDRNQDCLSISFPRAVASIIESLNRDGPDSVSGLAEDGLVTRERDGRAVTNKLSTRAE